VITQPAPGSLEDLAVTYARSVHRGHDGLAGWCEWRLDSAQEQEHARLTDPGALRAAAMFYVRSGLPVFPLIPNGKIPLPGRLDCCWGSHRRGCTDALTNVSAVEHWWTQHPTSNIGLATGHAVDVIDQDGPGSWRAWLDGADWPAVLGVVSTPRPGGVHRYIRRTGYRNGQQIAPGIDYRGAGGYVVAPPSVIDGRRYWWLQPLQMPTR
jgi:hypothetical protein